MEYTKLLAEFCAGLKYEDLPAEVVSTAKLCILDYVANVYGSLEIEEVRRIADYMRDLGESGPASALGCGFRTGMQNAAFLNGTAGEALEAQDGLRFGGNHPGVAVIPAALAAGDKNGSTGKEIITAIVAGYEAANRPAAAMHPFHTLAGFLPTGTCGTIGAAAAAAKLMRQDGRTTLNAIGISGYILPISMAEHLMGGWTAKIVQGGQAASAGITAAGLAGVGITGAPYMLEGSHLKGGFTQISTNSKPALDKITEGLGEHFTIMDIYLKPFTSCRHTHGAAQAAIKIAGRIQPGDIDEIKVSTYAIATVAVGKEIFPGDSFVKAQFSLPYVTAACLVDGDMGPEQLKREKIDSPVILDIAQKVKLIIDPAINKEYPEKTSTRVDIRLKNGDTISEFTEIPMGDPRAPMSQSDVAAKLKRFAGNRDTSRLDEITGMILDLENLSDIRSLTTLV